MTLPVTQLRHDLATLLRAALDAVDAGTLVQRALQDPDHVARLQRADRVDVIAAGKAAAVMLNAFVAACGGARLRRMMGVGPVRPDVLPTGAEWFNGGHPLPNEGSLAAARRALAIAAAAAPATAASDGDLLVVLLSGGGSALMALPAEGLSLAEKQMTARTLMERGADIYELNTVRKHLSAIKGGQLAVAARGSALTLAVSDVVGDDLSVIASGPTVGDASTFAEALETLTRRGGESQYPAAVVHRLRRGAEGALPETPKPTAPQFERSLARVIGPQRGALESAARTAASLGYEVRTLPEPVTGEARVAALDHAARCGALLDAMRRPACVLSAGETTVTVTGPGKGGRNQEFALALAGASVTPSGGVYAAASIGTDGIDGPTDAAGAIVDSSTMARAEVAGLDPASYLAHNDSYEFFDRLGDLVRTGPTNTNVGDIQIMLVG